MDGAHIIIDDGDGTNHNEQCLGSDEHGDYFHPESSIKNHEKNFVENDEQYVIDGCAVATTTTQQELLQEHESMDRDDNNDHLCITSEQRRLKTRWRSNMAKTLLFCYSYIVLGFSLSIFGPTLLGLANNTGTSVGSMGLLFTMNGVGYVISALVVGYLLDNLSFFSPSPILPNPDNWLVKWTLFRLEKLIMIFGIGLIAFGLFLFPLLKHFALLVIVSFLIGLGNGSVDCTANVMLVWTWREEVNPYMQGLHFSFGVGGFVCPLYIQLVNKIYTMMNVQSNWLTSMTFSYISLALICFTASICFMFVTFDHEAKKVLSPPDRNDAEAIDSDDMNTIEEQLTRAQPHEYSQQRSLSVQSIVVKLKEISIKRAIVAILTGVALLFYIGSRVGYGGLIHSYVMLLEKTRFTPDTASILTSLFWLTFTLGRLIAIPLSKWLSVRDMLLVDIFFTMASIAALVISSHYLVLWIGTAVIGMAMASQYPSTMSLPSAHLNMKLSGQMTSFMVVCGAMGEMIITPIMTTYLKQLMWILLIVCGSASIFYLILLFGIRREPDFKSPDSQEHNKLQMASLDSEEKFDVELSTITTTTTRADEG